MGCLSALECSNTPPPTEHPFTYGFQTRELEIILAGRRFLRGAVPKWNDFNFSGVHYFSSKPWKTTPPLPTTTTLFLGSNFGRVSFPESPCHGLYYEYYGWACEICEDFRAAELGFHAKPLKSPKFTIFNQNNVPVTGWDRDKYAFPRKTRNLWIRYRTESRSRLHSKSVVGENS